MGKFREFLSQHKKISIIIAIIFVVACSLFVRQKVLAKQKATGYKLFTAERQNISQIISTTGKIRTSQQTDLKFQASGLLTWVGVKEGDYVKKWQAIAQLDKRELEKNLEKALRDYASQRNDYEEMSRVTYVGHSPENALNDTAKRILEKNQWDLEKSVMDVELKNVALKLATLVSPIEGLVTHIDTPIAGVNITPAGAIFTIANPSGMIFQAEIDEVDIGSIVAGQKTTVTLDSYPEEEFEGTVSKIGFEAITTKGGGTAFKTEIALPENNDLRFKIGMNGDAQIIVDQKEKALVVPSESIFYKEGNPFITIMQKGKPVETKIKTGIESDSFTEILEGVSEGQTIIVSEKK